MLVFRDCSFRKQIKQIKQIKSEKYISAPGKSIILLIYRMQPCCAACGLRLSFK